MLHHIVMWRLKEEALGHKKAYLALEMKGRLDALVPDIPEIRSFQVGLNSLPSDRSCDLVLVSTFDDQAALERYVRHPEHQKVVEFVKQVIVESRAVDYLT